MMPRHHPHPNPLPQVGEGAIDSLSPVPGGEGWGEGGIAIHSTVVTQVGKEKET
jgi:hypothetical protein